MMEVWLVGWGGGWEAGGRSAEIARPAVEGIADEVGLQEFLPDTFLPSHSNDLIRAHGHQNSEQRTAPAAIR
jgi:hypothetical protein